MFQKLKKPRWVPPSSPKTVREATLTLDSSHKYNYSFYNYSRISFSGNRDKGIGSLKAYPGLESLKPFQDLPTKSTNSIQYIIVNSMELQFLLLLRAFPSSTGVAGADRLAPFTRYSASFSVTPAASLFSLIQSSHLLFGLPLFLLPTPILLTLFPRILLLF